MENESGIPIPPPSALDDAWEAYEAAREVFVKAAVALAAGGVASEIGANVLTLPKHRPHRLGQRISRSDDEAEKLVDSMLDAENDFIKARQEYERLSNEQT